MDTLRKFFSPNVGIPVEKLCAVLWATRHTAMAAEARGKSQAIPSLSEPSKKDIADGQQKFRRFRKSDMFYSGEACLVRTDVKEGSEVPEISALELQQLSEGLHEKSDPKPLIVDVRTEAEYRSGHVKHAVNASFLPPWSYESRMGPILKDVPKTAQIIVICLSAHRSIGALKWLRQRGYGNVQQLAEGMQGWRARQLPEQT